MTFLAPGFLIASGVIAAAVVALHFIVSREPRTQPLPTARFIPERPVRARAQALALQDILLLAMRVLLVVALGAALARPVVRRSRQPLARIILADRSRAVASASEVADSVRALTVAGRVLVAFDSSAAEVVDGDAGAIAPSSRRGRLSAALIVALRAAARMRDDVDSLEMVVISPLLDEEFDEATDSLRALWPGAIRLVSVAARSGVTDPAPVAMRASADDPLALAIRPGVGDAGVRVVRGALTVDDSSWARAGGVLVAWPREPIGPSFRTRQVADTIGAVIAGDAVVVAPFVRAASLPAITDADSARVIARWVDGEPAAVERALGSGCVRAIAIPVPEAGDLVLERRFARLASRLTMPCGDRASLTAVDSARRAALAGPVARGRAAAAAFPRPDVVPTPLAIWLIGLAIVLASGELLVRRRMATATGAVAAR